MLDSTSLPSVRTGCSSDERLYQEIRVRQDTEANWLRNNPVLKSGEFGYVIGSRDPGRMLKIGDGTVRWSNLQWIGFSTRSTDLLAGHHVVSPTEPPGAQRVGDLWLCPPEFSLYYWTGSRWELIATQWAIVSPSEPPPPGMAGVLWINTAAQPEAAFTEASPIKYEGATVVEQHGEPLADIVPEITLAIPIFVNGVKYLMPLMEE